jgi:GTP-binding protein
VSGDVVPELSETLPTGRDAALPLVTIVGRPNVGKSALFNRIVGRRKAIVQDLPGTTRDRNYDEAEWRGQMFRIVDTGGLRGEQEMGPYAGSVAAQVRQAMEEADAICFVVDVQSGIVLADEEVAAELRRAVQPVYLVANKADNDVLAAAASEFYQLGLGEPQVISAYHGRGVGDLLDEVVEGLPRVAAQATQAICNLAIIGRPNVGKSSLVNAVLKQDRMIVSGVPGTTRDAIDTPVDFEGHRIVLIDTAGIRRRGKVEHGVERASVSRAKAAVGRADVAAVVIDGGADISAQDQHVLGFALEAFSGVVLVINKTDLIRGDEVLRDRRSRQMRWRARFVPWAPVIWTSALTGERVDEMLRAAVTVAEARRTRISTGQLNALIRRATIDHPPASYHGRAVKIFYATQASVEPPTFVFFVNYPQGIHFSYERYLQRRIRDEFGFTGAPLRLRFRARKERHG